jgi:hypothetical protein
MTAWDTEGETETFGVEAAEVCAGEGTEEGVAAGVFPQPADMPKMKANTIRNKLFLFMFLPPVKTYSLVFCSGTNNMCLEK